MEDQTFSHLDKQGNPVMVDVARKPITHRTATAQAIVELPGEVIDLLEDDDIQTKKGPVIQTAILAGIMGAKKTSDLIPLCHPLALENCQVTLQFNALRQLVIQCTAEITSKTGVEMEALTGATIAALTVYDMCKAFSHDILIKEIKLMAKSGGKRAFSRDK
jgi:cyclic pyranopterin phosphate synthase